MCASHLAFQANRQVLSAYINSSRKIKHTVPQGVYGTAGKMNKSIHIDNTL